MQTDAMRERLFTMRMSADESERLEAVSKHYALNAASLIRMLVKREADTLGLVTVPKAAATKPTTKPTKK